MVFQDTYRNFSQLLNYSGDALTFNQWNRKPQDLKAAYLFVNFYHPILFAWHKARFSYVDEPQAVSTVLQYLAKNVAKIEADPARYTSAYINRVAYNCIRDLRWYKKEMLRDQNECLLNCSITNNTEDVDVIFEILDIKVSEIPGTYTTQSYGHINEEPADEMSIFDYIKAKSPKHEKLAYHLISPEYGLRRCSKSNPNKTNDPFADISVSQAEIPQLMEELKEMVMEFMKESIYA